MKCIGCGQCCKAVVCPYAVANLGYNPEKPCPSLTRVGKIYRCQLLLDEDERAIHALLKFNEGCTSPAREEP